MNVTYDDNTDLDESGSEEERRRTRFGSLRRFGTPPFIPGRERVANSDSPRPTVEEVKEHLFSLADAFGLPREFVHAAAETESGFDTQKVSSKPAMSGSAARTREAEGQPAPARPSYGVMQVGEQHIGKTVRDANGTPFPIGDDIKTDWKANAKAGVALLAQQHELAEMELGSGSFPEDRAQQAYSGYNAGAGNRTRYLDKAPDGLPIHEPDRAFLTNYHRAVREAAAQKNESGEEELPGPLRRLKENPGNLLVSPPPQLGKQFGPEGAVTPPSSFLGGGQKATQLPGPLQRLKESPENLFVPRSIFSAKSEDMIQQAARRYGYDASDFKATILEAAAQNQLSPNLLVGLAARESSLRPDEVNETGAKGLYQLLPARQKDLGIAGKDIFDYKVQIPKVATALREAVDRYDGNFDLAIASWTLGDARLQEHFRQGGMQRVRSLLLDRNDPKHRRIGPDYVDVVKGFL